LLIRDGQEDAVVDGDGTLKESRCSAANYRDVIRMAAQRGAGRLPFASRGFARLE
jgi:hypothetical protein